MVSHIVSALRSKPVGEQARLLGSVRTYVTDTNLTNLLSNFDFNNKKNDKMLQAQLASFTNPETREQVARWLAS
jgi:hypothetical protein